MVIKPNHPLRLYPAFRKFFIGNILLSVAARSVALIFCWWVVSGLSNGRSGEDLGLLMALQSLPYLIFSVFYGPVIDRCNKKHCILLGAAAQLLISLAIALVFLAQLDSFSLLCLLIFSLSCFMPLVDDTCNALLPELVQDQHLPAASATQAAVFEISNILAAIISTTAMSLVGLSGALIINFLIYLVGALFMLTIKGDFSTASVATTKAAVPAYFADLRAGIMQLVDDKPLFSVALLYVLYAFFLSQTFILIPLIVKNVLLADVGTVGIVETAFSIAVVIGALFISTRKTIKRIYQIFAATIILSGLLYGLIGNIQTIIPTIIIFFVLGAVFSIFWSLTAIVFQVVVPNNFKGRFFSLIGTAAYGVTPLSYLLIGYLIQTYSLRSALYFNGGLLLILGFVTLILPRAITSVRTGV